MKNAAIIFLQALGTFSILATALPLLDAQQWYVRVFDYPRMQIFALAFIIFILYLWLGPKNRIRDKFLLGGLAITIVYQAFNIYPYTFIAPNQVKQAEADSATDATLSILVANVLMDNKEHKKLINLTQEKNPDILLLLESDSVWQQAVVPASKKYPYRVEIPLDNTYGMHLYSQLPLRQETVSYLLDDDIPSIKTFVQLRSGTWVELHAVHPKPPVPTEDPNSKKRDAEIVMIARDITSSQYPVVVAGDFNDVAWSRTTELFQEVSGLLDPRIGRGFYNTFNANYPLLRWPLDHIFHSDHFKLIVMERLPDIASDHFPIYIKLSYAPENKGEQKKPEADEDTEEEATETIEEGKKEAREEGN
ncbi:endonuclease/exonuclease/phosphatase (EEP) superfamily protein YafD [Pontibacter aydingkolensis]|uniref:Endonuclease/exonuclease/phosphatase family protein n=1 Tax=Pontibacter aydingkolensis TaxID=1911536 RepID=A0ABS7CQP5_9BACT|nr:endonuclease/exonuclease/phosphatase family protein [Pontibacter aydingkolensis]MBW7466036.1 endonuclease/exonuclease/phosphatase family protein [Pontibacter aydingkolensis]